MYLLCFHFLFKNLLLFKYNTSVVAHILVYIYYVWCELYVFPNIFYTLVFIYSLLNAYLCLTVYNYLNKVLLTGICSMVLSEIQICEVHYKYRGWKIQSTRDQ